MAVVERRDSDGDRMKAISRARGLMEAEPPIGGEKEENEGARRNGQGQRESMVPRPIRHSRTPRAPAHRILHEAGRMS
jgi:hypothetical protein